MSFKLAFAFVALASFATAANYKRVACPDGKNTAPHEACCAFFSLRDDLQELFEDECGEDVHEVLRLTFHDAIGFSKSGKFQGHGADGSIIIFQDIELPLAGNAGIEDSVDALSTIIPKHPTISAGDIIQFGGAVGITNCPGAPQLQFLAGRPNATIPASNGTVPEPQNTASQILERMGDAGFTSDEVIHLLASHTIARADHVVANHSAVPFDTTPFTFDTQIFLEVLLKGVGFPFNSTGNLGEVESPLPTEGELRLQSDFELARDPRTACEWQSMVDNQELMMNNFKSAMAKLAVVGQDVSKLVDCSELIPKPVPPTGKPATYPATTGPKDLQQACPLPFPTLKTDPGQATLIPACPNGDTNIADCKS